LQRDARVEGQWPVLRVFILYDASRGSPRGHILGQGAVVIRPVLRVVPVRLFKFVVIMGADESSTEPRPGHTAWHHG
jgi:hypothetical protein